MRVWFTVRITHTLCLKRIKKNEVQRARKAETTKVQFSEAGETCIFWPIPGFKDTTFQQLWVFSKWTSLSVSICNVSGCSDTITHSTPSLTTHRYWQCYIDDRRETVKTDQHWRMRSLNPSGQVSGTGRCRLLLPTPQMMAEESTSRYGISLVMISHSTTPKDLQVRQFSWSYAVVFVILFVCLFYKFWMNRYMFSKNQVSGQVLMLMLCLLLSVLW